MNFTTHVMFGLFIGGLFYGTPEIMLLVGIGSAIPDLDREYGLLNKESFRRREVHRALCHNFLFMGILYMINPYLALGAFLHTLLDALTSARDRGVEWLYPFSRLVRKAVYDYDGKKTDLDPTQKIFFIQNEMPVLTQKTTEDLKPGTDSRPWRRTYGPALSGRTLDQGIFYGSAVLTLLLIILSIIGVHFIDFNFQKLFSISFIVPLFIGSSGVVMNFLVGEIDRKKILKNNTKIDAIYKVTFIFSIGIIAAGIILGIILNPQVVVSSVGKIPYVLLGIILVIFTVYITMRLNSKVPQNKDKEPPIV